MSPDSTESARWYEHADRDMERARKMLEWGDLQDAGFHLQQAAEKYLKGFLLSKGWKLRRIHHLDTLLNDASPHLTGLEIFRDTLNRVTEYYVEERYPGIWESTLTEDEIVQALDAIGQLAVQIRDA